MTMANGYVVEENGTIDDQMKFLETVSSDAVSVSPVSKFSVNQGGEHASDTTSIFHIHGISVAKIDRDLLFEICRKLADDPLILDYKQMVFPKASNTKGQLCDKIEKIVSLWEILTAKSSAVTDKKFTLSPMAKMQLKKDIHQFNKNAFKISESWSNFDPNATLPIQTNRKQHPRPYVWSLRYRPYILALACNTPSCRHCPCNLPFSQKDEQFNSDHHCSGRADCDYLEKKRKNAMDKKMTIEQFLVGLETEHGLPIFKKVFSANIRITWFLIMLEACMCLFAVTCAECNRTKARDMGENLANEKQFKNNPDLINMQVEAGEKYLKLGFLLMWRTAWKDYKKREADKMDKDKVITIDFDFGWFETLYIVDLAKCLHDKAFLDFMVHNAPYTILCNIPNILKYILEEDLVACPGRDGTLDESTWERRGSMKQK